MNLKSVGFYKETDNSFGCSNSIKDYIGKESCNINEICNYLLSGKAVIVSPGYADDVIKPEKGKSGIKSIYTDGEWIWPGDLAYYVKEYKLKLPDEFIKSMKKNDWTITISIDQIDFETLTVDGECFLQ